MHYYIFKQCNNKTPLLILLLLSVTLETFGIGLIYPFIIIFFELNVSEVGILNLIYEFLDKFNISITKTNLLILIVLFFVFNALVLIIYRLLITLNGLNFMNSLREKIYFSSFNASYTQSSKKVSKIYNAITNQSLESGNAMMLQFQVIESIFSLFILLILAFLISFEITIISIIIGLFFFLSLSFTIYLSKIYGKKRNEYNELLFKNLNIAFLNIRYLKAINSFKNLFLKIKPLLANILVVHLKFTMLSKGTKILNEPLVLICLSIVLLISFKFLEIEVAIIIIVLTILRRLYSRVISTISSIQHYNREIVSVKYCVDIVNDLSKSTEKTSELKFNELKKSIFVKDIHLSFEENNIFKNASIEIKKNSTTLIYGKSGSGKSSLINILLGLINVNNGQVFYDNLKIEELDKLEIRNNIGFVSQEPIIFNMSIRENLKIRDHSIDDKKIEDYINDFSLSSSFTNKNLNLDFIVDEKSSNLSGGEKQRLAFIREVIFEPSILILDEPTSSLDNENRDIIFSYLNKIKDKTTILIVSHDREFLEFSDYVYNLSNKNFNKIK